MTREERRHLWKGLRWAGGAALVVFILEFKGFLAMPEGMILDWYLKSSSGNFQVATLEIDDYAYNSPHCFNDHSPLEPSLVLDLVKQAIGFNPPKVVGIDLLTDSEKYSSFRKNADDLMMQASQHKVQLVWASGTNPTVEGARMWNWALGVLPIPTVTPSKVLGMDPIDAEHNNIQWGIPVFPPDEDASLRRFPRLVEVSPPVNQKRPTWARIIAQRYCATERCAGTPSADSPEEMLISYGLRASECPPNCKVSELFDCPAKGAARAPPKLIPNLGLLEQFRRQTEGKILLIGGTFGAARDTYDTPAGHISGLALNAYAVQTEIEGSPVTEVPPLVDLALDLVIGVGIVLIFFPPAWRRIERMLGHEEPASRQTPTIRLVLRKIGRLILVVPTVDPFFFPAGTVQRMIKRSINLVIVAFLLSILFWLFHRIWLGWVGMIVGLSPHLLTEIYQMDPRVPRHP